MANELQHNTCDEPRKMSYELIKHITNDLDTERIVGSGGFGTVYRGVYENGEEIAVKILRNMSGFDGKEFLKEFRNLRSLKHQNIVELVGFCNETKEVVAEYEGKQVVAIQIHTALCFEYVQNGSLRKHISDEYTGLNWLTRYKIIKGICRGLKYLREGLKSPVMHLDLKPDNILLDQAMVPKIADFGSSRLFGEENTKKTISSVGTLGYLPPEYIELQVISENFDIFSLGVIITKIITGHEGYNSIADMAPTKFVKQVHDKWRTRLLQILEPRPLEVYCHQIKRCIEIALECIKRNRQERPSIQRIVSILLETETIIGDLGLQAEQSVQREIEIIDGQNYRQVLSVDMHSTEPWILTTNQRGYAFIWNYQTQAEVHCFEVSREEAVYSAKFIEREEWLVVGGGDGYIYVYRYDTMEEVTSVGAHGGRRPVTCLAVHPTHSLMLSASDDDLIKLWDWKNNWQCTRTFEWHNNRVTQVMFDPNDSNSFASTSLEGTVKIWKMSSGMCIIALDEHSYGLHCLHYVTCDNRQLLVSGSSDGAAKIWDLQTDCCVDTLKGHTNHLNALWWHRELPVLITGSADGTVQIWKFTDNTYRLESIIGFNLGSVNALGYMKTLKRIVVGCEQGIAMMEVNLP